MPDRIDGVAVAVVADNRDPENMGRVRVTFPWLHQPVESDWARLCAPLVGPDHAFAIPAPGDEVLVAFEFGDIRRPYVLGRLWNAANRPPLP